VKSAKEFKVIECRGTAYEIGLQWGKGCKESILKVSENLFNVTSLMYQATREEVIARAMKFFPLVQEFDPYLLEMLRLIGPECVASSYHVGLHGAILADLSSP